MKDEQILAAEFGIRPGIGQTNIFGIHHTVRHHAVALEKLFSSSRSTNYLHVYFFVHTGVFLRMSQRL